TRFVERCNAMQCPILRILARFGGYQAHTVIMDHSPRIHSNHEIRHTCAACIRWGSPLNSWLEKKHEQKDSHIDWHSGIDCSWQRPFHGTTTPQQCRWLSHHHFCSGGGG